MPHQDRLVQACSVDLLLQAAAVMVLLLHLDEACPLHKLVMVNNPDHRCLHTGSHRCQFRARVHPRPSHRWASVGHLSRLHTVGGCPIHLPILWEHRSILHNTEARQVVGLPLHLPSRRGRLHLFIATHRVAVHLLEQPKGLLHLLQVEVDLHLLRRWEVWRRLLLDVRRVTEQSLVEIHRPLVLQEDVLHRLLPGLRVDALLLLLLRRHPGELVKGRKQSKIKDGSINYIT